jgi:hypothetical protein
VLADSIRESYPTYTDAHVGSAATTWLVVLSVIGVLGLAGWLFAIWAVTAAKTWAPWVATALFVVGTTMALTLLFVRDTSGDVGLAPSLGAIGAAPCLAGLAAVLALWRSPHQGRPTFSPLRTPTIRR